MNNKFDQKVKIFIYFYNFSILLWYFLKFLYLILILSKNIRKFNYFFYQKENKNLCLFIWEKLFFKIYFFYIKFNILFKISNYYLNINLFELKFRNIF
jgi:hypothetical protein